MRAPNEAVKKTRAAMAGLNTLQPRPPNSDFVITMANALPSTAAHSGIVGGSDKARITPVNTALRSPTVLGFRRMTLQIHSLTTHDTIQVASTQTA
jgi:hypothetical protein